MSYRKEPVVDGILYEEVLAFRSMHEKMQQVVVMFRELDEILASKEIVWGSVALLSVGGAAIFAAGYRLGYYFFGCSGSGSGSGSGSNGRRNQS